MVSALLMIASIIHPFHVSVTDIKFKEELKSIQISTSIFLDDLELGLKAYTGNQTLDIVDEASWDFVQTSLKPYVLSKFLIRDEKGRKYDLNYIGAEIEDDVMWCYLEIEKVKKLKSVTVTNEILHEVWNDQENLIHFSAFGDTKSARLFKEEKSFDFSWE